MKQRYRTDACQNKDKLANSLFQFRLVVKTRDQIGDRDVNKTCRYMAIT